ncbi:sensor histidine kinase [Gloeobacter kilaueensis]|nr:sensor histidine kinase [Gloeobacter kilaueensis]
MEQRLKLTPGKLFNHLKSGRALLRLLASMGIATLIIFFLTYSSYLNYWNKTIYRIQTVDFNILANLLPTKLSIILAKGDRQQIQSTLNSNYGLFGVIVTDCQISQVTCPNQKIIYTASGKYDSNWKRNLTVEKLDGHVFNILTSPPPMQPEWHYPNPRETSIQINKQEIRGKIIGRVYYLRNPPPSFLEDILKWLQDVGSSSSAVLVYNSIALASLITSFAIWFVIEFLFYRSNVSEQTALHYQQRMVEEREAAVAAREKWLEEKMQVEKYKDYFNAVKEVIDSDFVSVVNNLTQEISAVLYQMKVCVMDIIHDLKKAPLIENRDTQNVIDALKRMKEVLTEPKTQQDYEKLIQHLSEIDKTVETIIWSMGNLSGFVAEPELIDFSDEIHKFYTDLPPRIRDSYDVKFEIQTDRKLLIHCNPHHLRSIVKNALYNSCGALEKLKGKVEGQVVITCHEMEQQAAVTISDNGDGMPSKVLKNLYETEEVLNSKEGKGMGSGIVRAFLKLYGAQVKKANKKKPERGATVTFLFPLQSNIGEV